MRRWFAPAAAIILSCLSPCSADEADLRDSPSPPRITSAGYLPSPVRLRTPERPRTYSPYPAPPPEKRGTRGHWAFLAAWFTCVLATLWLLQWAARSWARTPDRRERRFCERYQLGRVVGSGGVGVVYEALDRGLMRKVAIKRLRGEIRGDARARKRFLEEARTVASLRHPNIVEIYSVEQEGPDLFLVFEYLEASTLQELIRQRGRLELAQAVRLFHGVCRGLEHAHRRGVIHRDLKPLNIMVDRVGRAKIMDFGLGGTQRYMAPEAEQGAVSRESDLYALTVSLYETLTGISPFPGGSRDKLLGRFAPVSRLNAALPPGLDAVMRRGLDPDPAHRFHSSAEFFNELAGLVRPA